MSVLVTYTVHGSTIENEQGLANGWGMSGLTEKGVREAEELRDSGLNNRTYEAIISSDLPRAIQTAEIAFGKGNFTTDPRLREINFGDATGGPHDFKDTMVNYVNSPFPNGESYKDVEHRMRLLVSDLKKQWDGHAIVLLAHQGPQLALDVILKGMAWPEAIVHDWRLSGNWQPGWMYSIP